MNFDLGKSATSYVSQEYNNEQWLGDKLIIKEIVDNQGDSW